MKGIIFNIAEEFLIEKFGETQFDEIMESCDLQTKEPFVAPGTYPYEDMLEIIKYATQKLDISASEFLRQFGRYSFFKLAGRYPHFVKPFKHPKNFLKTIENVVHVEVRKLYTNTYLPTFIYEDPSPDELIITYFSARKLYAFMEGLIMGVGDFFSYNIHQQQRIYIQDNNEYCDFYLYFEPQQADE